MFAFYGQPNTLCWSCGVFGKTALAEYALPIMAPAPDESASRKRGASMSSCGCMNYCKSVCCARLSQTQAESLGQRRDACEVRFVPAKSDGVRGAGNRDSTTRGQGDSVLKREES